MTVQYYKEAEKTSFSSSSKIDKYVYLTGKEILRPDQGRMIEQLKFTCIPLGKDLEKQIKTIEDQGKNKLKL